MTATTTPRLTPDLLLDPAGHPNFDPNIPHTVETILQVLGVRGSVAQGIDLTKNQRLSVQGAFGYYVLGPRILPAEINIEGLPAEIEDFRNAKLMLTAAGRYDAYFERGVKTWDVAAGALLCRCAGLDVRRLATGPCGQDGVLVAAPTLADALEPLLA